jgi:arsenical pump membrane protein
VFGRRTAIIPRETLAGGRPADDIPGRVVEDAPEIRSCGTRKEKQLPGLGDRMIQVAALSIVVVTVGLSLRRPRFFSWRIDHAGAAALGAAATVLLGIGPPDVLVTAARFLAAPMATLISLMLMTQVAERAGLFDSLGDALARRSRGDGRRLFAYIFATGALVGTVFTNDAAVLIFTPIVFALVERLGGDRWRPEQKLPFYFSVLYVANLVGALVIANPINLVVAGVLGISFGEFAWWMTLPALGSMAVSFAGLWLYFRKSIPRDFVFVARPAAATCSRRALQAVCAVVVLLTLGGFFTENLTGAPPFLVAGLGAALLLLVHKTVGGGQVAPLIRGVGWDVLLFMAGMFVVGLGLRQAGITHLLGAAIADLGAQVPAAMRFVSGTLAAIASALINNHPTADLMAFTIQDLALPSMDKQWLGFAALIGGDLGPKMLPIGSLAALIWFRLLRDRGVEVPYSLYVRIGIPVTLAALLAALATLELQIRLSGS